jgi:hypothetical protein
MLFELDARLRTDAGANECILKLTNNSISLSERQRPIALCGSAGVILSESALQPRPRRWLAPKSSNGACAEWENGR